MDYCDDWRGCGQWLHVIAQPFYLGFGDACFQEADVGWMDRIEDDEVIAIVVERVEGVAHAVLIHFLAVGGRGGGDAASAEYAEDIVVADRVVKGHADELLSAA